MQLFLSSGLRRFRGLHVALVIGTCLVAGLLLSAPQPAGASLPAQATPEGRLSPCGGSVTSTLSTNEVSLCEEVEIAANADPFCPVCPNGVNVVFVQIDQAFYADWMDEQAVDALNVLLQNRDKNINVGVIHYDSSSVRVRLQMTENVQQARGPLMEPPYGHDPFGDVVGAAREALKMLRDERDIGDSRTGDERCEFIIFFASTKNIYPEMGEAMRDAANMIHREKVTLFVGCPETHPDYCDFTREMPKRGNYTEAEERGKLRSMTRRAMDEIDRDVRINGLELTQFVPKEMQYIPGSASVEPSEIVNLDDGRTWLKWAIGRRNMELAPQTVTYKAKPLAEGTFAFSGTMKLTDSENKLRELMMPSIPITVAGNCITPSPEPTPTDTPVPTATNTATPEPTNTPTPVPEPIYLPIAVNENCQVQWVYSDVALVLDLSTSMNRETRAGRTKLAAAQDAAKLFVDLMDFSENERGQHDQVAIVGFNRTGWIEQALTNDSAALYAAIDNLPNKQEQYTRLDLAFEYGALAVAPENRIAGNTPAIVMLTDGLPNQVPLHEDGSMETTVLLAAQAAKAAGSKIYTVGLGAPEDINPVLLSECATSADLYFYAPDAEELSTIYSQIAYSFGCPRGRHSWSEPWP